MKRVIATLAGVGMALCANMASATTYLSDPNLGDFASASTNFAVLQNFFAGDVAPSTYATTYSSLSGGLRVYDGGSESGLSGANNWLIAVFGNEVNAIRVFPNIDHYGSQYDGYQYTIYGSNDATNWTQLYDTTSVSGSGEPFTIGSFTGTAPTQVDNVLTPGNGPAGTVGYIADFHFNNAYKYYAFGASTVAFDQGNTDQELSGVAAIGAPEPATWAMFLLGFGALGFLMRAKRRNETAVAVA